MYLWVQTIRKAPSKVRRKLKEAVLEGFKGYNAKFKKVGKNENWPNTDNLMDYFRGPDLYEVQSYDPKVLEMYNKLKKEQEFQYVGIVPHYDYYMENAVTEEDMQAQWNHEKGSAALLYKMKGLPIFLIVSPDADLHDSTYNKIPGNRKIPMRGGSG